MDWLAVKAMPTTDSRLHPGALRLKRSGLRNLRNLGSEREMSRAPQEGPRRWDVSTSVRRLPLLGLLCLFLACEGGRSVPTGTGGQGGRDSGSRADGADGGPSGSGDGGSTSDGGERDGGASGDGGSIDAGFSGPGDAGLTDAGFSGPGDAGFSGPGDTGSMDAGFSGPGDAGFSGPGDAGFSGPGDAGFSGPGDAGFSGPPDVGSRDAGFAPPAGSVVLSTTGCTADFSGDIVVGYNGSLGIASLRGPTLTASLQFDLRGQSGTIQLSSNHRVQTGLVVNLVTWSTWTNLAQDSAVFTGMAPDPITGTLVVHTWDPAAGIADIELRGVTIQNVSDRSLCTLNGRAQTSRLGR